jgi:hypothetical protein
VLGEARYISNPAVETELNAAAAQRREATAYFLGLLDYFAAGVDAIEPVATGDTLPEHAVGHRSGGRDRGHARDRRRRHPRDAAPPRTWSARARGGGAHGARQCAPALEGACRRGLESSAFHFPE